MQHRQADAESDMQSEADSEAHSGDSQAESLSDSAAQLDSRAGDESSSEHGNKTPSKASDTQSVEDTPNMQAVFDTGVALSSQQTYAHAADKEENGISDASGPSMQEDAAQAVPLASEDARQQQSKPEAAGESVAAVQEASLDEAPAYPGDWTLQSYPCLACSRMHCLAANEVHQQCSHVALIAPKIGVYALKQKQSCGVLQQWVFKLRTACRPG